MPARLSLRAGVVATTSGFAPGERKAFETIRRSGVVVVTCFPSGDHAAPQTPQTPSTAGGKQAKADEGGKEQKEDGKEEKEDGKEEKKPELPPIVRAQHLLPAKARILLMCVLTKTRDPVEVQRLFNEY